MSSIAETTLGPVQGKIKHDVLLFAGVPYAAAPVGNLRFKAAAPHAGWSEVRPATRFSPAAPQVVSGGMTSSAPVNWSEDCLYLNITTPQIDDKKRPVFFWIHGGGYRTGQGAIPWYDGTHFALQGDIVVVSINYRMGALGFTDLSRFGSEYETSGVNGTLDQIKALQWVVENIGYFGGDANQITIAGESAGGFSVGTLMGSPLAQGLFQRAIPQSGAAHHTMPSEAGSRVADLFLDTMKLSSIAELEAASVEDILKAQGQVDVAIAKGADIGSSVSAFYPCTGNSVLPESPLDAIKKGMSRDVDLLLGSNKDEGTLFVEPNAKVDEQKLLASAIRMGAGQALIDTYKGLYPEASASELSVHISTDYSFRIPALRLAEARAEYQANTWMYFFKWESRQGNLKSTHALEIPFVFNNLDKPGVDAFIGPGELPQAVASKMFTAWLAFIRDGDPGWGQYELKHRETMCFDTRSEVVMDPDQGKHEVWAGIR